MSQAQTQMSPRLIKNKLKPLATLPHVPFIIDMTGYDEDGSYVFLHPQTGRELPMAEALINVQAFSTDSNWVAAWWESDFKEPKFVWLTQTDLQTYRNNSSSSMQVIAETISLQRGNFTILASAYLV